MFYTSHYFHNKLFFIFKIFYHKFFFFLQIFDFRNFIFQYIFINIFENQIKSFELVVKL